MMLSRFQKKKTYLSGSQESRAPPTFTTKVAATFVKKYRLPSHLSQFLDFSTGNYTRPNNMFCSLTARRIEPVCKPVNTDPDHLPIQRERNPRYLSKKGGKKEKEREKTVEPTQWLLPYLAYKP